jgi:hypothetical protein
VSAAHGVGTGVGRPGRYVGITVGLGVGCLGPYVGTKVGNDLIGGKVGSADGCAVGDAVGFVGEAVGSGVGIPGRYVGAADDDLVDGNKDKDKDKELKKGKGRDRHRRILEGNLNSSFKGNSESHRAPPKPPRPPKNSFRNHPNGESMATAVDTRPERPVPAPAGSFDYEGGREDSKEYSC